MANFAGALGDVADAAGEHEKQCGEDNFKYTATRKLSPFDARLRTRLIFAKLGEHVERF